MRNDSRTIVIEPYQVYDYAVKMMKPEDIDHHGNGKGFDDLYLKANKQSQWIVEHMSNRSLLGTFISPIDGCMWFDFPFCYPVVE